MRKTMLRIELEDNEYPKQKLTHVRKIARAVVLSKEGKIAIIHLKRNDIFGDYDYYELPGGGVDVEESLEDAAIREIEEEVGVVAKIITPIGEVVDAYNLINRQNENHYFLLQEIKKCARHLESYEQKFFQEVLWVSLEEAIRMFLNMPDSGVSKLVKNRELPILKEALKYLKNK